MKQFMLSILITLCSIGVFAQVDCPRGYEKRKVKCNGQIVVKCIPENDNCNRCWLVEFENNNRNGWYPLNYFTSYDEALNRVEGIQTNGSSLYNANVYRIYINDSKYCNANPNEKSTLKNDLLNKIRPFLQRYIDEIANYRRYYNGQPYKTGTVFIEYGIQLKQAEENLRNFQNMVNGINDDNLSQIENMFDSVQQDSRNLKQYDAKLKNNVNILNQEKAIQQQRQNNTQQYNREVRSFQQKQKQVETINQAVVEGINNIGNIYKAKLEADRQARLEESERQKAEQIEKKRIEKERENRRNKELEAVQQKRANWQNKSNLILKYVNPIAGNFRKAVDIYDEKVKSVYYVVWYFNTQNEFVIYSPIEINKSPDGDWISHKDLIDKLEKETKVSLFRTPDGTPIAFNELNNLLGYFESGQEATGVYNQLIKNATNLNVTILKKNNSVTSNNKSFWEE